MQTSPIDRFVAAGCLVSTALLAGCPEPTSPAAPTIVEAACGQCQFELPGDGCDLAVRIDGKAYLVDGTGIDDHGDAHGSDGFCNAVRRARVTGQVVDGRYVARSFELLPASGE